MVLVINFLQRLWQVFTAVRSVQRSDGLLQARLRPLALTWALRRFYVASKVHCSIQLQRFAINTNVLCSFSTSGCVAPHSTLLWADRHAQKICKHYQPSCGCPQSRCCVAYDAPVSEKGSAQRSDGEQSGMKKPTHSNGRFAYFQQLELRVHCCERAFFM